MGKAPRVICHPGEQDPEPHPQPPPPNHQHAAGVHCSHDHPSTDDLPTPPLLQGQGSQGAHRQAEPHHVQCTLAKIPPREHLFLHGGSITSEQLASCLH